jgi:hypothetical protein
MTITLINEELVPLGAAKSADTALGNFLLLTDSSLNFADRGWTAEQVFWSRYFWFRLYAAIVTANGRGDPGLEQQVFQVLESPSPACTPDWHELERIDAMALEQAHCWSA